MTPLCILTYGAVVLLGGVIVVIGTLTVLILLLLWCIAALGSLLELLSLPIPPVSITEYRARYEEHIKMMAVRRFWTRSDWEKAFREFRHKVSVAERREDREDGRIVVHPAFYCMEFTFCGIISEVRLKLKHDREGDDSKDDDENLLTDSPEAHDFASIPAASHMELQFEEHNTIDDEWMEVHFEVFNPQGIKVLDVMNALCAVLARDIYTTEGPMPMGDALRSPLFFEGLSFKEYQGDTLTGNIYHCT
ncbi:hypothetical protein C8R46DRAFT_1235006 [Mycena filopes]|nr:hypothetical protein C8R46DRAFT_1235006 [Mycena filopes]